jgi:hypothetical protein
VKCNSLLKFCLMELQTRRISHGYNIILTSRSLAYDPTRKEWSRGFNAGNDSVVSPLAVAPGMVSVRITVGLHKGFNTLVDCSVNGDDSGVIMKLG